MALEKKFVKEGIRNKDVEEFLSSEFDRAGYSHSEIQRTPLSIRITVYAQRPGLIIGRGGKNIEILIKKLKERFGFENPQLDVQEVDNSDLDANIIAKWMASSIERGLNYKRASYIAVDRIMKAGAIGVGIIVAGKIGGDMARTEKFSAGYLKYAGEPSETDVDKAYSSAQVKMGTIGIQVRIMKKEPRELEVLRMLEEMNKEKDETAFEIKEEVIEVEEPKEEVKEEKVEEKQVKQEKKKKKETKPKKEKKKRTTEKKTTKKKTTKKKKKKDEKDGDNKKETT